MDVTFQNTVSTGTIIQLVVIGGGLFASWIRMDSRVKIVEKDNEALKILLGWKAGVDQRFNNIDERCTGFRHDISQLQDLFHDLRRGRGFVREVMEDEINKRALDD